MNTSNESNLPKNHYFIDGILLPVEIIPINNTENCCRKCKGVGKTCDEGGAFIYCDILNHFVMQESGFDVSGDSYVGCNNFQPIVVDKEIELDYEDLLSIIASNLYNIHDHSGKHLMDTDKCDEIAQIILSELKPKLSQPKKDISDKELEYNKTYVDGLTRDYGTGAPNDYQYTGPRCIKKGCKRYVAYETHHHKDCPFYPGSMSERYDNLLASSIPIIDKGEEATQFAEWLQENRWFTFQSHTKWHPNEKRWYYTFEQGTAMGEAAYQKNYVKTTSQLYQLFKSQK